MEHREPAPSPATGAITDALLALRGGERDALDRLFPLIYQELREIAHRLLRGERTGHTLSTTDLVHEAYLRLIDQTRIEWEDRRHYFAVAARAMRQVLVDYARRYQATKRHGALRALPLDESLAPAKIDERADDFIALDQALSRLAAIDPRLSQVVECRFFGGLTEDETAEVVGVTARTVRSDWVKAKEWLSRELEA
jgi:RNA polymerase sigma factor (TIGR02999 family)